LRFASPDEIAWIEIWGANIIQRICKRLGLRQQVIATASIYLRRFYLRNSYCETDTPLVCATCCYVAAKAEETPVHIKSLVNEARHVFQETGFNSFQADTTKLAEMEFYLIEELDFHLIVFQPYRSLVQLTSPPPGGGEPLIKLDEPVFQMAWYITNDVYRTTLMLVHAPHLIALAAIYLALALQQKPATPAQRKSEDDRNGEAQPQQEFEYVDSGGVVDALASLDVPLPLLAEIAQELVAFYDVWHRLEEPPSSSSSTSAAMELVRSRSGAGGRDTPPSLALSGTSILGSFGGSEQRALSVLMRMWAAKREESARPAASGLGKR